MQDFGELISDFCTQITEDIKLHSDPNIDLTVMYIGSGYHSYMLDIKRKCNLKVRRYIAI